MHTIGGFLSQKRDGKTHSEEEIRWFVSGLTHGAFTESQIGAWLSSAYINGLDDAETVALTLAMANSGEQLDTSHLPSPVIDKHSTGGIGDTVTFLLLPILAACDQTMVKLSGSGLGFTGGTLDKAKAIPGFRTDLKMAELASIAKEVGCALGGQTADLAPADKVLYAMRSETETVSSTPLIAASVMSKKLAANADAIVLDVKVGSGAFMKSSKQAVELAETMVRIGLQAGKTMRALVTDMNQPLNMAIGNALEIRCAVQELNTGCKGRLGKLAIALAEECLAVAGKDAELVSSVIQSGAATRKMKDWVSAQGGDPSVLDDPNGSFKPSAFSRTLCADRDGYVCEMQGETLGEAARLLGAGRTRSTDEIDLGAGIEMKCSLGDAVHKGDPLCVLFSSNKTTLEDCISLCSNAITVGEPASVPPLIHERIA